MQYANPASTWVEWSEDNADRDEATKLLALREYIAALARTRVSSGDINTDWANKKLHKLGITDLITTSSAYCLEATVTGKVSVGVWAEDRTDAIQKFHEATTARVMSVTDIEVTGDPTFTSGPEDADPEAVDVDAPTTVDATLVMLREVIMLGNIAGPRWNCDQGTNRVLAAFGLNPLPTRKTFTVAVPVEGVMKTTVEAYDEASAKRVATWRWDNGRTGYDMDHMTDTDAMQVATPN